jgi:hypothetical protein
VRVDEADGVVAGLSPAVAERIRVELDGPGDTVLRCLRTAAAFVDLARTDPVGLRFAESAAFNLREALNRVVEDQEAAEGGLRALGQGWERLKNEVMVPGADTASAFTRFDQLVQQMTERGHRVSSFGLKLSAYLRRRAGVDAPDRPGDLVEEYTALRARANGGVHRDMTLAVVEALLVDTVAWFARAFAPPDQVIDALVALARTPWTGPEQIVELRRLATNDHHVRRFFTEVTDPGWLAPVYRAGLVPLRPDTVPWPATSLVLGLGKTDPNSVAAFLDTVLVDTRQVEKDKRIIVRFELLRMATQLGPAGYGIATSVLRSHPDHPAMRSFGVSIAQSAEPRHPVVCDIADTVLGQHQPYRGTDQYDSTTILDRLQAGLTADNIATRASMLAAKIRAVLRRPEGRWGLSQRQRLSFPLEDHPETLLLLCHHLVRVLATAREWGIPATIQLGWLGSMGEPAGGRLRASILTGAVDVDVAAKITVLADRIASPAPTAEDLALVEDILAAEPSPEAVSSWRDALGTPTRREPQPESPRDGKHTWIPEDWIRAWRWSAVLPAHVYSEAWRAVLDTMRAEHGDPSATDLRGPRPSMPHPGVVSAPLPDSEVDLTQRPPLEAAALIGAWSPSPGTGSSPRDLANALANELATAMRAEPAEWSRRPADIITALAKPLYIERYVLGLTDIVEPTAQNVPAVLDAALTAVADLRARAADQPGHTAWTRPYDIEDAVLRFVEDAATNNADLSAVLDRLWELTWTAVFDVPAVDDGPRVSRVDAYGSALNSRWGLALQTALRLATWEYNNTHRIRAEFEQGLDRVLTMTGSAGLELRAMLAAHRALLEAIARDWLDAHTSDLFRDGPTARQMFQITMTYAPWNTWFYDNLAAELFDSAVRGTEHAAEVIAFAVLNRISGYEFAAVTRTLAHAPATLSAVAEQAAYILYRTEHDQPTLTAGVEFWEYLLNADRRVVAVDALAGLGTWAIVDAIDDTQWAALTAATLTATRGRVQRPASVARRAARLGPCEISATILYGVLGQGDYWERDQIARCTYDALRAAAETAWSDVHARIRTRLVDLGYHDARNIQPPDNT